MEGPPRLNEKLEAGVLREPTFGPIALDLKSKTVRSIDTNKTENLSAQEYQILWLLVRAQGAVLSRSEMEGFLYEDVAEEKDIPLGSGTLNVVLDRIKKKIGAVAGNKIIIENLHNVGWRLSVQQ